MKRFGAFCSSMPADWSRNTKWPALPSMIGTSAALTSTSALSMPRPANADSRCSTVETFDLAPVQRRAQHGVADVLRVRLDVDGSGRSVRRKMIRCPADAGRKVISTFLPVCSPTPVARIEFFSVR